MSGIFEAVKGFFSFVTSFVDFILKLIQDLVYVVGMLKDTIQRLPGYLGFLPTTVVAMFSICLGVVVVYKVTGRD